MRKLGLFCYVDHIHGNNIKIMTHCTSLLSNNSGCPWCSRPCHKLLRLSEWLKSLIKSNLNIMWTGKFYTLKGNNPVEEKIKNTHWRDLSLRRLCSRLDLLNEAQKSDAWYEWYIFCIWIKHWCRIMIPNSLPVYHIENKYLGREAVNASLEMRMTDGLSDMEIRLSTEAELASLCVIILQGLTHTVVGWRTFDAMS